MFEKRTKFKDSLFYDVSAWSFLHSFNLDYTNYSTKKVTENLIYKKPNGSVINKNNYAYLFSWDDYYSPKILFELLKSGIRVKVGTQPFSIGSKNFDYGTLLISLSNQNLNALEINKKLEFLSEESGINFYGYNSSYTKGIDFGSNDFINVSKPNVALIVGDGVNSYDAGEIWHLLDTRYKMPITKIKKSNLLNYNLSKYLSLIHI